MKKSMLFLVAVSLSLYAPPKSLALPKTGGGLIHLLVNTLQSENPQHRLAQAIIKKKPDMRRALLYAAQEGKSKAAFTLIDHYGVRASVTDEGKQTPLLLALDNGHQDIAHGLLDRGADPNAKDRKGHTALITASCNGNYKFVQRLLAVGARVSTITKKKETALMFAAGKGHLEATRSLLSHGARLDQKNQRGYSPLMLASSHGEADVVDCLLKHKKGITEVDKSYALALAAERGYVDIVQILLDADADPKGTLPDGRTCLTQVLSNFCPTVPLLEDDLNAVQAQITDQHLQMMLEMKPFQVDEHHKVMTLFDLGLKRAEPGSRALQMLIERVNVNRVTMGSTPLIHAASYGHEIGIPVLLGAGADVHATDKNGMNALLCAAKISPQEKAPILLFASLDYRDAVYTTIARHLLDAGIDIEAQGSKNRVRALHLASENGAVQFVQLLIDRGAFIDATDGKGSTPLMYAAHNGHGAVVKILLDNDADPTHQDGDGDTALICASRKGHYDSVKQLLNVTDSAGQLIINEDTIDIVSNRGDSALTSAIKAHHDDIAKLLLVHGANPKQQTKKGNALQVARTQGTKRMASHLSQIMEVKSYRPTPSAGTTKPLIRQSAKSERKGDSLFEHIRMGNLVALRHLKKKDTDAYAADRDGNTPLGFAIKLYMKKPTLKRRTIVATLLQKEEVRQSLDLQDRNGKTPLLLAASNPKLAMILLGSGANPQLTDHWGNTIVSSLAQSVHRDGPLKNLLQYLSQRLSPAHYVALLNQQDDKGRTALMHAVRKGNFDAVRLLIQAGADATLTDSNGFSVLHIVQNILAKLKENDAPELKKIAAYQELEKTLKETEATCPEPTPFCADEAEEKKDDDTTGPATTWSLLDELEKGPEATLQAVQAYPLRDFSTQCSGGATVVMMAIQYGVKNHILGYILRQVRTGHINLVQPNTGDTALSKELNGNCSPEAVGLLLQHGADVRRSDIELVENKLREAQQSGNAPQATRLDQVLTLLRTSQATTVEVNAQLLQAAQDGNLGQLGRALAHGAHRDSQDLKGNSALMLSIQHDHQHITRNLIQQSKLDLQNEQGHTALMLGAGKGTYDTVDRLLRRGADDTLEDTKGKTAYAHALEKGHIAVANRIAISRALQTYTSCGDTTHVQKRHHDPRDIKLTRLIGKPDQDTKNKPYCGYVGDKFTSFFPQLWKPHTIYMAIKTVLATPDKITERPADIDRDGKIIRNALMVRGVYQDIQIEVIISNQEAMNQENEQYQWNVITAYPIVENGRN